MNFKEYKKVIETTPETSGFEYNLAVIMLHPEWLPLAVASLNNCTDKIIKVPNMAVNRYGKKVPVTAISSNAFKGNTTVTDIILGNNIDRIGAGAFAGCTALERITIPKKVSMIPLGTFEGCTSLSDIYYEGTPEEWDKIEKYTEKREVEYGNLIPCSPVMEIVEERLIRLHGNEALSLANIHFNCKIL